MKYSQVYTDDEVMNDLKAVMDKVGRYPSYEDVRKHGTISPKCMRSRLGPNWSDVKRKLGWIPINEMPYNEISDLDAGWIAGIIDGEGCFRLRAPTAKRPNGSFQPIFCMSLRDDDTDAINELIRIIGSPHVRCITDSRKEPSKTPNAKPSLKIYIENLPVLLYCLLPALERCGLRTKKKHELKVFRLACQILLDKRITRMVHPYTDDEKKLLWSCHHALSKMKQYNSDKQAILVKYELDQLITL